MQNISVIGSTGSIGTQSLNIIRNNPDKFRLLSLSAHSNISLLKKQLEEFKPLLCIITDKSQYKNIDTGMFPHTQILFGEENLKNAVNLNGIDVVLISIMGLCALSVTVEAIKSGKRIALANKEVMVSAGDFITALAKERKAEIIPVDSEHSAIFQCLQGERRENLKRLILTASGGPFKDFTLKQLENVTPEMALKHPSWKMGKKITVDSATLMNKGLEVIEARWLFDAKPENIGCIVQPQSIIHSMVELNDNSVLAQMSYPSMEIPIQLAFTYPERIKSSVKPLDFAQLKRLEFFEIDRAKFPCVDMAYDAIKKGGLYPAVLNAANEAAVDLFLREKIRFTDIPRLILKALGHFDGSIKPSLDSVYYTDKEIRKFIFSLIG